MDLHALGSFLRSRRERLRPEDVGLPHGARRRVPGLRRDEVARLADASVDYYTELEQAGGSQPSALMLAALARALRLDGDERDHLYQLAGRPLPPATGRAAHVHPGMLDLLTRLEGTPARLITDLHVTLVQNRLAAALLGPVPHGDGIEASFIHAWFTEPLARERYAAEEHEHQSRVFVADLRAVTANRAGDPGTKQLITTLVDVSDEFAALWSMQEVAVRRHDRKRLVHPALGVIDVTCLSLLSEDGSQRLLWFTPSPDSDAREKLELLSVIGDQELLPGRHPVQERHAAAEPNPT